VVGFKRILFCGDFSGHALLAFEKAAYLARREGGHLAVLHVVGPDPHGRKITPEEAHALAEEVRGEMRTRYLEQAPDLEADLIVRRGHPGHEILAQLADDPMDLVVMGAQGLSGVKLALFGSVSEEVSRKAPCSCLIVRGH